MGIRTISVLCAMLLFGASYSLALYRASTVKFLNPLMMNAWRDITFIFYVVIICLFALTSERRIEKEFIGVAICYLTFIFTLRIAGHFIAMPNIQNQLLFINGTTFVLCVMVLISALRHGYFKK